MISVSEALDALFALAEPLPVEMVPLESAAGRVLAADAVAGRDQPPFAASSMDGYALKSAEADMHAQFKVIGESAAGHRFGGRVGAGQCVRIFTGAPVPEGTDKVILQENVTRQGDVITIVDGPNDGDNIRPAGGDFAVGTTISAPRILTPQHIALLASMNIPRVPVRRQPRVALISTGDELVLPGEDPGPDQIIASNTFGLKALLEKLGCIARILPIARDNELSLKTAFSLAKGNDLVVTIGGASVGDHDLVASVAADLGMEQSFYKVAMRPGKPLMAGRVHGMSMVGLPGNPVSAMVCGHVFLVPMLRAMLGLGTAPIPRTHAVLRADLGQNGPREHYMRAVVENGDVTAFDRQDSSLLTILAEANALIVRPPQDGPRRSGEQVEIIPI